MYILNIRKVNPGFYVRFKTKSRFTADFSTFKRSFQQESLIKVLIFNTFNRLFNRKVENWGILRV